MNTYLGSTIVSAGTVQILAGQLPAASEYVGCGGTATLVLSAGSNSAAGGTLYVGNNLGDSGTYILSGSGLLSVAGEYVGNAGSGSLTQSGGINTASTLFNIGYNSGSLDLRLRCSMCRSFTSACSLHAVRRNQRGNGACSWVECRRHGNLQSQWRPVDRW